MDFFEAQDQTQRTTKLLIGLLLLAVLSLIAITIGLCAIALYYAQTASDATPSILDILQHEIGFKGIVLISLSIIGLVTAGSLYKFFQLKSGGHIIAASMNGRLIQLGTQDSDERKILNVVEEMAIASGTPIPSVYVIEDESINAFVAGHHPKDTVLGITRGCIQLLNRQELQGVMAHEFSHIFHGDMKLNMRLIALLHGILMIGLLGRLLLPPTRRGRYYRRAVMSSRGYSNQGVAALGLALMALGFTGTFFGSLIQAAISRQREFLADASAVQYTRDASGIAGALKKIGGHISGSQLNHPNAAEFAHLYFSSGLSNSLSQITATHPPLNERIQKLEPRWNGQFPKVAVPAPTSDLEEAVEETPPEGVTAFHAAAASNTASTVAANALNDALTQSTNLIGQTTEAHLKQAHNELQQLPSALYEAAHTPYSARAIVFGAVIEAGDSPHAHLQWRLLKQKSDSAVYQATQKLHVTLATLGSAQRMNLIELCLPTLKQLTKAQYQAFKQILATLCRADKRISLSEWVIFSLVKSSLEPRPSGQPKSLKQLQAPIQYLLTSTLEAGGPLESKQLSQSLNQAMADLGLALAEPKKAIACSTEQNMSFLEDAVCKVNDLKPLEKPALLKSLKQCIVRDGKITADEAELFRAIARRIDCPMPPLVLQITKS